jgi:hypothetical protein
MYVADIADPTRYCPSGWQLADASSTLCSWPNGADGSFWDNGKCESLTWAGHIHQLAWSNGYARWVNGNCNVYTLAVGAAGRYATRVRCIRNN